MLERSRAALAEERARSQTVLLQIAAFEAERETLQQEINSMLSQNTFVFSLFCDECIAMCHLKVTCWCFAALQQRVSGLEIHATELANKLADLELIKVCTELQLLTRFM